MLVGRQSSSETYSEILQATVKANKLSTINKIEQVLLCVVAAGKENSRLG